MSCNSINVPIILQYEDTPLIQIVKGDLAGFTTEIPIYHEDGTYVARVKGSRVFATSDGEKAGITLEHPDKMTRDDRPHRTTDVFEYLIEAPTWHFQNVGS